MTVASMVFSEPNEALTRRELNEATASQLDDVNITAEMCRRILFPQCYAEESGGSREEITPFDIDQPLTFDDRTFFQLKVQPDYQQLEYNTQEMVAFTSLYFPPSYEAAKFSQPLRVGAQEEYMSIQVRAVVSFVLVYFALSLSSASLFHLHSIFV
jgi:hypothetical protein